MQSIVRLKNLPGERPLKISESISNYLKTWHLFALYNLICKIFAIETENPLSTLISIKVELLNLTKALAKSNEQTNTNLSLP